jgi:hypothetical protein
MQSDVRPIPFNSHVPMLYAFSTLSIYCDKLNVQTLEGAQKQVRGFSGV